MYDYVLPVNVRRITREVHCVTLDLMGVILDTYETLCSYKCNIYTINLVLGTQSGVGPYFISTYRVF